MKKNDGYSMPNDFYIGIYSLIFFWAYIILQLIFS